jgi:hypothetical protein
MIPIPCNLHEAPAWPRLTCGSLPVAFGTHHLWGRRHSPTGGPNVVDGRSAATILGRERPALEEFATGPAGRLAASVVAEINPRRRSPGSKDRDKCRRI